MESSAATDLLRARALAAVRAAHPQAAELGCTVVTDEFCGGPLLAVTFRTPAGQVQESYVHLPAGSPVLYQRAEELVRHFVSLRPGGSIRGLVRGFVSLGGFAGLIALLIAASICGAYVRSPGTEVPDFLAHILTSFISFYMGHRFSHAG